MRYLFCLAVMLVLGSPGTARAVEPGSLAECSIKVFKEINKNRVWSGKPPAGCETGIYVEKRPAGVFVTTWSSGGSQDGWVRVSFSAAMAFYEVADRKTLEKAGHDITARAVRIERCLDSIIRVNDPLECRDHATKTYSAGYEIGVEHKRKIWLDDNGRHTVVEYAYGDARAVVTPPADLFGGAALPPGMNLDIHVFDTE